MLIDGTAHIVGPPITESAITGGSRRQICAALHTSDATQLPTTERVVKKSIPTAEEGQPIGVGGDENVTAVKICRPIIESSVERIFRVGGVAAAVGEHFRPSVAAG